MEEWGFGPGDEVELRGLSKLDLNGQRGTLLPLEMPEQAKALGRLAVMLRSGKRLSLKVENLFKVPPPREIKTGGDLGEAWSEQLSGRGKAASLPLRSLQPSKAAKRDFVAMTLNLQCLASFPKDAALGQMRLQEIVSASPPPDAICVQEGIEGWDMLGQAGYTKLVSSAVRAQTVRESLYSELSALDGIASAFREKLLVNELYVRSGSDWEVVETGVEQTSSDLVLVGGDAGVSGPLAARSSVWARFRPRASEEGPFVFLLGTQLSGGPLEDQFFLDQLSRERRLQVERALGVFDARATEGDLGILAADFDCPPEDAPAEVLRACFQASVASSGRVREDAAAAGLSSRGDLEERYRDYLCGPFAALRERGWRLAYNQAKVGATSRLGFLADYMAMSREVPVVAERLIGTNQRSRDIPEDTKAPISDHNAVRAAFGVLQKVGDTQHHAGLVELPMIGFGTCFMPEDMKERVPDKEYRRRVDELTEECVRAALGAGVRLFESANKHSNQASVGRTLEEAMHDGEVSRSELFICGRIFRCKDQAEVRREVELMLRELRVDYVDLLLMDLPPERAPKAWGWIEEVYREGKTRYLGIANFDLLGPKVSVEVFREFLSKVEIPPSVYCMEVHPFNTNEEMSECCRALDIRVMAYSPTGGSHKIEAYVKTLTKSDARDLRPLLKVPENPVLRELGKRHGVSAAQVALRWNLQRGHCVIPKSFDQGHVVENAELFHFSLSEEEMGFIAGLHKGIRAERFFQQAYCTGKKSLPKMTRDAQDECAAILSKMRGMGEVDRQKLDLAQLYQQQQQDGKGKGKGPEPLVPGGSMLRGGGDVSSLPSYPPAGAYPGVPPGPTR